MKLSAGKKELNKQFKKGSYEIKEVNAKQNEEFNAVIGEANFKKWQAIMVEERKTSKQPE